MHPLHASKSDSWRTPADVVERARRTLCGIDLDPASSHVANETIKATRIITATEDGLKTEWLREHDTSIRIFLNPPSGKAGSKTLPQLFWQQLVYVSASIRFSGAIFVCFSLEQLTSLQRLDPCPSPLTFPTCILRRRLNFVNPLPGQKRTSPTHGNAIVYVPGNENRTEAFVENFKSLGQIVVPYHGQNKEKV